MVSSAETLNELVNQITARARLYQSCLFADLRRLKAKHGAAALKEALVRIEAQREAVTWDAGGHRDAVAQAVDRLAQRWHADPENFPDGGVKV
jgi:hypothetical protein